VLIPSKWALRRRREGGANGRRAPSRCRRTKAVARTADGLGEDFAGDLFRWAAQLQGTVGGYLFRFELKRHRTRSWRKSEAADRVADRNANDITETERLLVGRSSGFSRTRGRAGWRVYAVRPTAERSRRSSPLG